MIRLKLDLPTAKVNYNEFGAMTSIPIANVPNQIKNFGIAVEITGYAADTDFFAFSLSSPAREFTLPEQQSLLTMLGFKTVPFVMHEKTAGDALITMRDKFARYNAQWVYPTSGVEFPIPKLTHIKNTLWTLVDKTLTLQVVTDDGLFEIQDLRNIAYFQPGTLVKVFGEELLPYRSAPIANPIPSYCPKCNNPLKRIQIYADLPLFYKCTNSFCDKLVLDEPGEGVYVEETSAAEAVETSAVPAEETVFEEASSSFREGIVTDSEIQGIEVAEEEEATLVAEQEIPGTVFRVINLECDADMLTNLEGYCEFVEATESADFILTKTARSITKRSRTLSKDTGIPLIAVEELEAKINE